MSVSYIRMTVQLNWVVSSLFNLRIVLHIYINYVCKLKIINVIK